MPVLFVVRQYPHKFIAAFYLHQLLLLSLIGHVQSHAELPLFKNIKSVSISSVAVCGGHHSTDTTKLKGTTTTNREHHVGFQCIVSHYSICTLTGKLVAKY